VNPHLKIALSNPQSVSSSTVWAIFHDVLMLWWQLPTHPDQTKLQVTKSQQCLKKLRLLREIVIALIVCHKEQVYHGDLKGTNILLDRCLVTIYKEMGASCPHGLEAKIIHW
jgi:tRNA A-37 threonylcarbamoyl transferase component Bud32